MRQKKEPPKDLLDWLAISETPNWTVARPLGGLISLALLLMFVLALVAAVVLLLRAIAGGEGSFAVAALIVALIGAPFLVWNTWIRHRTLNFQKEGHLTDRLAKAVEQLGAEKTVKEIVRDDDGRPTTRETTKANLEVRIGGLLSLERIAQDSTAYDKGRDHVRVMEIICAYIRNNAPAREAKDFPLPEWDSLPDDPTKEQRAMQSAYSALRFGGVVNGDYNRGNLRDWLDTLSGPRDDIALALKILERRSMRQRRIEAAHGQEKVTEADWPFDEPCPQLSDPSRERATSIEDLNAFKARLDDWKARLSAYRGYRLDLRKTCLQGADMGGFGLGGTLLQEARLEGANLGAARLEAASLRWARLEGANLGWARLEGADLREARLEGADLREARLEGADLGGGGWINRPI